MGLAPDTESARLREAFSPNYQFLNEEIPIYRKRIEAHFAGIENVKIVMYDKIPTCACFLIDDRILVSCLVCSERARNGIHLLIQKNTSSLDESIWFKKYETHLSQIWK
jgi:hypothetical protein